MEQSRISRVIEEVKVSKFRLDLLELEEGKSREKRLKRMVKKLSFSIFDDKGWGFYWGRAL